jgi:tetratricopeptide (TPR) repeat protein
MKQLIFSIFIYSLFCMACGSSKPSVNSSATDYSKINRAINAKYFEADKARLSGDVAKAKESFLQIIKDNPNNDAAFYYYASILMKENDAKAALPFAKKANDLNPSNKYYQEQYADALIGTNNVNKGVEIYKQLAETDKKFAERYLNIAAEYESRSGNYDASLKTYDQIEKQFGISEKLAIHKIINYKAQGNIEAVIKTIDKLIADDPSEIKYYLMKIDAYQDTKQQNKADALIKQLETQFSNDARLLPKLAINAIKANDTAQYLLLMQQCMVHKGIRPEQKVRLLEPMIELASKDTNYKNKILIYAKQIVDAAPEDSKAIAIYADALYQNDQYEQASALYKKLLIKEPNHYDYWKQLMYVYLEQNMADSLLQVSKRAMDYFPNQATVYVLNAQAYSLKENWPQAIKQYNHAMDLSDGNKDGQAQIFSSLGDVYNSTKQYSLSDSCFNKALQLLGNDATTLNNYAYFLCMRNTRLDEALKMSEKSLTIRKNEKSYLDTYAWIFYMQKKYSEAEKYMKQALELPGENDATMLEHYGDILYQMQQKENAIDYWKQAKEKGSKSESIDKKIITGKLHE